MSISDKLVLPKLSVVDPSKRRSYDEYRVVPNRHPMRWVTALIAIALVLCLAEAVATNDKFRFSAVGDYFFSAPVFRGLLVTLELTAAAMIAGTIIGVVVALMRSSENPVLRVIGWLYLWVFRGTPVLVQLVIWFNLGIIFPTMSIDIPGGEVLYSVQTNAVITGFVAALLGLGLNEGAYMSEIVRAGLLAVDPGQSEAGAAIGLSRFQRLRYIILPQAFRIIVPPTGNQLISMLKTTSLVSVIAGGDLLTNVQNIYSSNFYVLELLIVASAWYLIITSIISVVQYYIEKRLSSQNGQPASGTPAVDTLTLEAQQ